MSHLCIHGVELGSTVGAGEQQLLGVPAPHVLGKLILALDKLAVREWAVKLLLVVVLGQVRDQRPETP